MDDHLIILTSNPESLVSWLLADMADRPDRMKLLTAYILHVANSDHVEETLRNEYVNVVAKGVHALPVPTEFAHLWVDSSEHLFQPINDAVLVHLGTKGFYSAPSNIDVEAVHGKA